MTAPKRLIDDPAYRARDRELRRLFTAWDRATAYGCAVRGQPFDPAREAETRRAWFTALECEWKSTP